MRSAICSQNNILEVLFMCNISSLTHFFLLHSVHHTVPMGLLDFWAVFWPAVRCYVRQKNKVRE